MPLSYEEAVSEAALVQSNVDKLNASVGLSINKLSSVALMEDAIASLPKSEADIQESRMSRLGDSLIQAAALLPKLKRPELDDNLQDAIEKSRLTREYMLRDLALTEPIDEVFMSDLAFASIILEDLRQEQPDFYFTKLEPLMS